MKKFFQKKIVKITLWIHLAVFLGVVGLVIYFTHKNRNAYERAMQEVPYDAIIVPGYPYKGEWHDIMKMRVYWSKYLWEQGYTSHIIYSGGAVYSPYVESVIMKEYAIKLGVPENAIFTETKAEHSTENLYYSYQLARRNGFKKVALASDPFQAGLLQFFTDSRSMEVEFLPIQYDIVQNMELKDVKINDESAFQEEFEPLPEREGFWKRWQGTLGGNIDEDK